MHTSSAGQCAAAHHICDRAVPRLAAMLKDLTPDAVVSIKEIG